MLACVVGDEVGVGLDEALAGAEGGAGAGAAGEKIAISGGSILEVSQGRVRDVQAYNDPGPAGRAGNSASDMWKLDEEVWGALGTEGWGLL